MRTIYAITTGDLAHATLPRGAHVSSPGFESMWIQRLVMKDQAGGK